MLSRIIKKKNKDNQVQNVNFKMWEYGDQSSRFTIDVYVLRPGVTLSKDKRAIFSTPFYCALRMVEKESLCFIRNSVKLHEARSEKRPDDETVNELRLRLKTFHAYNMRKLIDILYNYYGLPRNSDGTCGDRKQLESNLETVIMSNDTRKKVLSSTPRPYTMKVSLSKNGLSSFRKSRRFYVMDGDEVSGDETLLKMASPAQLKHRYRAACLIDENYIKRAKYRGQKDRK